MLFNSFTFLFAFLPVTLIVYFSLGTWRLAGLAIGWLIVASLAFYAWWSPSFLILLVASCLINFGIGRALITAAPGWPRKLMLVTGLVFNLCVIGYFKYAGFLVANFDALTGAHWSLGTIVLPLGISFFTFQKIAFLVDAYHGQVKTLTLRGFLLFVFFFPQLIAGPIVHHSEFMPQIGDRAGRFDADSFATGLTIFAFGLFKKTMLADSFAQWADPVFNGAAAGHVQTFALAWVGTLAYTLQLYFDFSGYSDMAIGLGRMMGFGLPINFNSPYKSGSIIEFWRRWHMTLSRFLRDYLYIPLGGNRKGPARRYVNLAVVMLLGGLWHGAAWTFVVWGALHGAMLMVNHAWIELRERFGLRELDNVRLYRAAAGVLTFFCVALAWVVFRAATFDTAVSLWKSLFGLHAGDVLESVMDVLNRESRDIQGRFKVIGVFFSNREFHFHSFLGALGIHPGGGRVGGGVPAMPLTWIAIGLVITLLLPNVYQLMEGRPAALTQKLRSLPERWRWHPTTAWAVGTAAMLVAAVLTLTSVSPFLYFQF